MPQERLSMRNIGEVLRLKWESRLSHRVISNSCGISPGTVCNYVQRAQAAGVTWPLPEDLDEDALYQRLFPQSALPAGRTISVPDWTHLHTELRRPGVTLRLLWVEYREAHPDGYGYSQFCDHYRQWAGHLQPTMRLPHKAGEKLFVDYAGQTVPVVHPGTGEVWPAQLFVAVLGASSYILRLRSGQALCRSPVATRPAKLDRRPRARLRFHRRGAGGPRPGQSQSRRHEPLSV